MHFLQNVEIDKNPEIAEMAGFPGFPKMNVFENDAFWTCF